MKSDNSLTSRLFRAESGAAALEFAVVCPLLIYVVLTTVYFGIYISAAHSVQQLAADGARVSVAGLGETERRSLTTDYVKTEAARYYLIKKGTVDVGVESDASDAVTVTVSYDASPILSWYPQTLIPFLNPQITRNAVVRAGGF